MVVFLYLLNEKTSLLVQVPAGIAAVIEVSSCRGAVNVCLYTLIHRLSPLSSCWLLIVLAYCQPSTTEAGEGHGNMAVHVCAMCFGLFTVLESREGF